MRRWAKEPLLILSSPDTSLCRQVHTAKAATVVIVAPMMAHLNKPITLPCRDRTTTMCAVTAPAVAKVELADLAKKSPSKPRASEAIHGIERDCSALLIKANKTNNPDTSPSELTPSRPPNRP